MATLFIEPASTLGDKTSILLQLKKAEEAQKEVIAKRKAAWEAEKEQWAANKALAKMENRKFTTKKLILGKLPPAIPCLKAKSMPEDTDHGEGRHDQG